MGDMADYDIEQGLDMWQAHLVGDCLQDCIYCEEEVNQMTKTQAQIEALEKAKKACYDKRRRMEIRKGGDKYLFDAGIKRGLRKAELILRRHIKKLKDARSA